MMGGTSATRALGTLLVLAAYGCFAPRENLLEGFEEVEPQEVPWALISGWLVIQAPSRDGSITLYDGEAKEVKRLASGRLLRNPTISPDHSVVAYTHVNPDLSEGIWAIPLIEGLTLHCPASPDEGCGVRLRDDSDVDERGPAWSTGGRLAYFVEEAFFVDGEIAHAEGSVQRCCSGRTPGWAPDGTLVVYLDDMEPGLYRVDPDSKEVSLLFADPDPNVWLADPSVSPDGSRLAYTRTLGNMPSQIWVSNLDGSDARLVTDGAEPVWSPEGNVLAYGSGTSVFLINPDGGSPTFLANGRSPSSQP
jgi:dipeptidyl aminopeptidase/acylaminoacyl peptidase